MPVISIDTAGNPALNHVPPNVSRSVQAPAPDAAASQTAPAPEGANIPQAKPAGKGEARILQNVDGVLAQIGNVLQRMMTLAAEAASGQSANSQGTQAIDAEYALLKSEVARILSRISSSDQTLLSGIFVSNDGSSFVSEVDQTVLMTQQVANDVAAEPAVAASAYTDLLPR
jgi:flagellin-like hook-associated protein FlgL